MAPSVGGGGVEPPGVGDGGTAVLSFLPCPVGSRANSRTTSSQSERSTASISAKALKMLTLQKRQLDHLQQQVDYNLAASEVGNYNITIVSIIVQFIMIKIIIIP